MLECWVAPYTGAWIETQNLYVLLCKHAVAPYTGAWIETFGGRNRHLNMESLLIRERGLKPHKNGGRHRKSTSLLIRERGLKLVGNQDGKLSILSLLIRQRGLKPRLIFAFYFLNVAPYTGAWIETYYARNKSIERYVAPYTGAWIETLMVCK